MKCITSLPWLMWGILMKLNDIMNELEVCREDGEVLVELHGSHYIVQEVIDTSQGVILIIDPDSEERDMR